MPSNIDPSFQSYVDTFKQALITYKATDIDVDKYVNNNLIIKFDGKPIPEDNKVAFCITQIGATPTIIINTGYWDSLRYDRDKEAVVFHELGHCVLRRDHVQAFVYRQGFSVVQSLMYPSANTASYVYDVPNSLDDLMREEFIAELINNRTMDNPVYRDLVNLR